MSKARSILVALAVALSVVLLAAAAEAWSAADRDVAKDLETLEEIRWELGQLERKEQPTREDRRKIEDLKKKRTRLEEGLGQYRKAADQGLVQLSDRAVKAIDAYFEAADLLRRIRQEQAKADAADRDRIRELSLWRRLILNEVEFFVDAVLYPDSPDFGLRPSEPGGGGDALVAGGGAGRVGAASSPADRLARVESTIAAILEALAKLEVKLDRKD